MGKHAWVDEFPAAVTVCNTEGVIIQMNERSAAVFEKSGGFQLVGKSMMNCHPPAAREKILEMLERPHSNVYTIEKNGVKKMIYQSPWYDEGRFAGLVEISFEIPEEIPHFVRGKAVTPSKPEEAS